MKSPPLLIARDGIELGALPEAEVRELLEAGFLRPSDHYRAEGSADCKPLSELVTAGARAGEAKPWLKRATQAISAGAEDASGKIKQFVATKRGQVNDATRRVLEDYLPQIRSLISQQLIATPTTAVRAAVHDDELMRKIFGAAHDCLPKPVRRFVPELAFIEFCLQNRARLIKPRIEASNSSRPSLDQQFSKT